MSDLLKEMAKLHGEIQEKVRELDQLKVKLATEVAKYNFSIGKGGNPLFLPSTATRKPTEKTSKASVKRGKRGEQSAKIIAALSKPMKTGELKAAIGYTGSNLSAVLAGLKKADKIDKDKTGAWFAVKK